MPLRAQSHRSSDGLITLVVEAPQEPESAGLQDWIVGTLPGPWHTHPDLLAAESGIEPSEAVDRFIEGVLDDSFPLVLYYDNGRLEEVSVRYTEYESLDAFEESEQRWMSSRHKIIVRTWSGSVIREIVPRGLE